MKRFLKSMSAYILGFMTIAVAMGATWVKLSPPNELRNGVMVTSGGTTTGTVLACLNCSGQNFIAGLRDAYNGNLYISTGNGGSSPILWTAVATGTALGSSDILIPSQNAVSGFVNTKIASYLPLANSGTYFNLFSGTYFNLYSGTYFNANSGVYFEANSGKYFNANSGVYFNANSGVYFNLYSGTYFNANSGTYYNSNPKGYITGSALTPYCLLSGNQMLTGTFKFSKGVNITDQSGALDTCTGTVLGRITYYVDNFYGCTARSGRVLLN